MSTSPIQTTAARIAITAIVAYQVILILLIFLRPDLDPYWHTISEWALGRNGWIMSVAFVISSVSYASLFIALRQQLMGVTGVIGMVILGVCVIGAAGVGIFTMDPMDTPQNAISTRGMIHIITGSSQLFLFPFAALLISLSLAMNNPEWSSSRKVLIMVGGLPLLALIGFIIHMMLYIVPLGDKAYGPGVPVGWPPRIVFFSYMIWVVAIARTSLSRGANRG